MTAHRWTCKKNIAAAAAELESVFGAAPGVVGSLSVSNSAFLLTRLRKAGHVVVLVCYQSVRCVPTGRPDDVRLQRGRSAPQVGLSLARLRRGGGRVCGRSWPIILGYGKKGSVP